VIICCDSRNPGIPTLDVSIHPSVIYAHPSLNSANITVTLSGDYDNLIANQYIDMSFNSNLVNINVQGLSDNANFLITDSQGSANGIVIARNPGTANIVFSIRGYRDSRVTRQVIIRHPYVSGMSSTRESALANGVDIVGINATVTPRIQGTEVRFTAPPGVVIASPTALTNSNSVAMTNITSTTTGKLRIRATLVDYDSGDFWVEVDFE
jgi:hypothetical protein